MSETTIDRVVICFTLVGALGLTYFGVLGLVDPAALPPKGSGVNSANAFAQYLSVRNLAIAATLVVVMFLKQRRVWGCLMLMNGAIQASDGFIGAAHSDAGATVAPVVLAVLYFMSARYLLKTDHPKDTHSLLVADQ